MIDVVDLFSDIAIHGHYHGNNLTVFAGPHPASDTRSCLAEVARPKDNRLSQTYTLRKSSVLWTASAAFGRTNILFRCAGFDEDDDDDILQEVAAETWRVLRGAVVAVLIAVRSMYGRVFALRSKKESSVNVGVGAFTWRFRGHRWMMRGISQTMSQNRTFSRF